MPEGFHPAAGALPWRVARWWLPRWFRDRYGRALLEVHVQRAGGDGGARGGRFWLLLLVDVALTGVTVRLDGLPNGGDMLVLGSWLRQELGHAVRRLRRQPGYALAIAATLGLGIGANVTMFSVLDRLFLSPPPGVHGSDRVRAVYVWGQSPFSTEPGYMEAITYPDLAALGSSGAFEAVAGHGQADLTMGKGEASRRVKAEYASASYFPVLGLRPSLGRFYGEDEDRIAAPTPVAVLSYGFWQRQFGGDRSVLGREVDLGKGRYTIVGVGPKGFAGTEMAPTDVWIPLRTAGAIQYGTRWRDAWGWYWLTAVARLRDGEDVGAAAGRATAGYHAARSGRKGFDAQSRIELARINPGRAPERTPEATVTGALGVVAILVLLIACANVMNLLLARGIQQRRQYAVQAALGMSRGRAVTQMLAEALVLATVGGGLALLLARLVGPLLIRALLPEAGNVIAVGSRAVVETTLLVAFATLLAGLLPSLRSSRMDVAEVLRTRSASRGAAVLRRFMLGLQAALSVVLLVGAGLFLRSLQRAESVDVGLADNVLALDVELQDGSQVGDRVSAALEALRDRLRQDPAVAAVATTSVPPFSGMWVADLDVPGPDSVVVTSDGPQLYAASGDYFRTLGIALVRGRVLTDDDDRAGAQPVVVVNQAMAKAVWPGRDAIGECLLVGKGADLPCTEVVGVVEDYLPSVTATEATPTYYVPTHHPEGMTATILMRPKGDPAQLMAHVRQMIAATTPEVRYADITRLSSRIQSQMVSWRLGATLLSLFGALALLVAAAGFYSVVAFDVAQRRFELSVRRALGAPNGRLLRTVTGRTLAVTGIGLVIGLGAAMALGRLAESLLFRISATDPPTYLAVCVALLGAGAVAGASPLLRALRADPARSLREEA